jgi:3-deoxy-7-phosphoheptulonate synthase
MALQARDVEEMLTKVKGRHIPAAHESLLLPYDKAFMQTTADGRRYLLSADLPWVGLRTNQPDGPQVQLLSGIENPVGAKLGVNTTREHLVGLRDQMNANRVRGKLVLMPRLALGDTGSLQILVDNIADVCPESLIVFDMHGITVSLDDGTKIRCLEDIVEGIEQLSAACSQAGLRIGGVHLEAIGDDSRLECIDTHGELPTHPGNVDPQLNPRQVTEVLDRTAHLFNNN